MKARLGSSQQGPLDPGRRPRFSPHLPLCFAVCAAALLASGLVESVATYQASTTALARLQRDTAVSVASTIESFIKETERQLGWTIPPPWVISTVTMEQRRIDQLRLLRQVPAITDVQYLDGAGNLRFYRSHPFLLNPLSESQRSDYSQEPWFRAAQEGRVYYWSDASGSLTEPYLMLAISDGGPAAGVTVAQVSMKFAMDVLWRLQFKQSGLAYLVGPEGWLVVHPDVGLNTERREFASLPQVQAALAAPKRPGEPAIQLTSGHDLEGRPVLATAVVLDPPGWLLLVEQPREEVLLPVYGVVLRNGALLLVALAGLTLVSWALAARSIPGGGATT